jgi:DNA-binding PadR family transcriptional regulator
MMPGEAIKRAYATLPGGSGRFMEALRFATDRGLIEYPARGTSKHSHGFYRLTAKGRKILAQ